MRRHPALKLCRMYLGFQSQTRSRSTCDFRPQPQGALLAGVSISDEKPLHMRQEHPDVSLAGGIGFNLRREAAPHATLITHKLLWCLFYVSISDEKPLHMRRLGFSI